MSDATKSYVNRIHEVADKDPSLLIAHHYTRYLGDLSGGQILRKMAIKAMDLPSTGEGVKFYLFENIPDAKKFKMMYRSCLDGLRLDKMKADEIVNEANYVFLLNIYLFQEIDTLAGFEEEQPQKKKLTIEEIHVLLKRLVKKLLESVLLQPWPRKKHQKTEQVQSKKGVALIQCCWLCLLPLQPL